MILKKHWLKMILSRKKTMEIRGRAFKPGNYHLGCKGVVRGMAILGDAVPIPDEKTWTNHREEHCVESAQLPYKKTWGLPIVVAKSLRPVPFVHTHGAVSIVKYRAPSADE